MYDPDEQCRAMITSIKNLCKQKNMTTNSLAKKAGISTSTMSYLLNGKTKPQVCTVLMLCNVLGVSIGELFDDSAVSMTCEPGVHNISCEEGILIDCYRHLSNNKKKMLKVFVDMLYKYDDE